MDSTNNVKEFCELPDDDKDLTMFFITDLRLEKIGDMVKMSIMMKRKVQMELITTYLPTKALNRSYCSFDNIDKKYGEN